MAVFWCSILSTLPRRNACSAFSAETRLAGGAGWRLARAAPVLISDQMLLVPA
jgi:hypothetical protein